MLNYEVTVTHYVMLKLIVCTVYVHSGKLEVKEIWLYGARPIDVQISLVMGALIRAGTCTRL